MNNNQIQQLPSEYSSFYDIEINNIENLSQNELNNNEQIINYQDNNNQLINNQINNRKLILNRLIFLFFIFSIAYIIYEHHYHIGKYLNKITSIM